MNGRSGACKRYEGNVTRQYRYECFGTSGPTIETVFATVQYCMALQNSIQSDTALHCTIGTVEYCTVLSYWKVVLPGRVSVFSLKCCRTPPFEGTVLSGMVQATAREHWKRITVLYSNLQNHGTACNAPQNLAKVGKCTCSTVPCEGLSLAGVLLMSCVYCTSGTVLLNPLIMHLRAYDV